MLVKVRQLLNFKTIILNKLLIFLNIIDFYIVINIADGQNSSSIINDKFQKLVDYINSLLQNLPTSDHDKDIFSQSVDRFRDIHASLASSSKFKSILSLDNMSMK